MASDSVVSVLVVSRVRTGQVPGSVPGRSTAGPDRYWIFIGLAPVYVWRFFQVKNFPELDRVLTCVVSINILVPSRTCWHVVPESGVWMCGPGDWSCLLHAATLTVTRNSAD